MSHGSTPSLETPTPPFNLAASKLIAVALIGILACGLRFTKLGDWTFAGDELATTEETKMLFGELSADPSIPEYRLPRIIPLSYPILYVGYHAFGESEFGSRVVSAIFGTLLPPLIVFCLWSLFGPYSATAAGLLLACSPEAIFQSQQNRFYTILALVTGVCVGLAALGVSGRRVWLFALACGLAIIAPLFHPVLVGLAFGLVAIVTVTMPSGMDGTKQRYWLMAVAASVVVTGVVVGYQMPQLSGWNSGAKWGYSSARAILGGVSQLGCINDRVCWVRDAIAL